MYRPALFAVLVLFMLISPVAFAQNQPGTDLSVAKAQGAIKIDGDLNEESWQAAMVATNFFLNTPNDSLPASFQTEARVTFDDEFFYVSFVCFDDKRPNVVQSLRRDFEWSLNDHIALYMDPYNDFTNGFYFGISPYGVQREGIMSGGVEEICLVTTRTGIINGTSLVLSAVSTAKPILLEKKG